MKETKLRCRVCWEDKDKKDCVLVTTKWATESSKTIKDVTLLCVPWMVIQDASYICKPCLWQLKFTFDFIKRCLKTENILNEGNSKHMGNLKLEDILEKSLKRGNKIQIFFENPANQQTDGSKGLCDVSYNESVDERVEDKENISCSSPFENCIKDNQNISKNIPNKIHTSAITIPSEHDYCINNGTQMNVEITKSTANNPEISEATKTKICADVSKETDTILDTREKDNVFDLNDSHSDSDSDCFVNALSTECTTKNNILDSCEDNIVQSILPEKEYPEGPGEISEKNDAAKSSNILQNELQDELTELLDIAASDIWFMTTDSEVTTEQQDDLVRDGVNILNLSTEANKKKRTVYLCRDLYRGYHKCSKCNIVFISRCDYLDHIHLHRKGKIKTPGVPIYTCKDCNETFTLDIDFRTHTKIQHGVISPHVCSKCNRRYKTHKLLKDHTERFKDQEKCVYKCAQCNKVFHNLFRLLQHEADVKDAPSCNYKKCNVCLQKFTKEEFKIHSEQVHSSFLCQECGKSFAESIKLSAHIKHVHKAPLSMCHECGKILSHPRVLEHHIQSVHGEKKYMCDKCPRQFTTQMYLRRHSQIHSENTKHKNLNARRKWQCDKCGKAYVNQDTLRQHERMFHLGIHRYVCPICNEGFLRKDYLKRHVKYHDKYSKNTCPVCNKSFGSEWRLGYHKFTSHDENGKSLENSQITRRPKGNKITSTYKKVTYKCVCKICNKVLANKDTLKSHYRAHLKLRMHKCDKCGVTFQTRLAVTNHVKLHEDPNFQFSCNICHAYKSSSTELEKHMLEVHKSKKYKCSLCPEAFGRKHLLSSHETIVHKEENYKKEALLKILQRDQVYVPTDIKEGAVGFKTNKGVKLGKLEVDINKVFNQLVMTKHDFDVDSVGSEDTIMVEEVDKNFQEIQNPLHFPAEKNVIILSNEYGSVEDARACKILEEENRINDLYINYRE